jgi:hypothetical protein
MDSIEWHGLYSESWGSDLVPEAYAHPAKYSRGLIRQIYAHMLDTGMIEEGDTIGDPFGGQAGGALDALLNGLHWRGVELEPRFVTLGNQNIELWNGRYAPHMRRWGTAVLVAGDSRQFADVVGGVAGCVSSPPYAELGKGVKGGAVDNNAWSDGRERKMGRSHHADGYGSTPGQLGSMPPGDLDAVVSSPPHSESKIEGTTGGKMGDGKSGSHWTQHVKTHTARYGGGEGNLGHMKEGDLDAAISSPPYADTIERGDGPGARWDADGHPGNPDKVSSDASYGRSPGQVGRLDGCVTSPPFMEQQSGGGLALPGARHDDGHKFGDNHGYQQQAQSQGNLANESSDTFWQASKTIVEQVHLALKPGGYVAWVTGDFVRKGKRVEFGRQWLALCESCGFEAVTWAIAWKTEHHGTQRGIFEDVEKRTDRVSFFRRLANEKNPDAAILNEDVIFMRKR